MAYNSKTHLRDNIEAIKLSIALDKSQQKPIPEDIAILQKYSGFGGLKCILNPVAKLEDATSWSKSDFELFPMVAELRRVIRANSRNENKYRQYMGSLKNSILTAFYTPSEVVTVIADTLREQGVTPNRFLDPSAGLGEFVSAFKQESQTSMSFEKDILTGRILTHLYPDDRGIVDGYENIESRYKNYFDVVSSNIPFGDVAVFDSGFMASEDYAHRISTKAIHNYFFVKGLDSIREGGVLAFITLQGVMNAPSNESVRKLLMERADLVSAIRLSNNLFVDSANTEVGSSLIILQKNTAKERLSDDEQSFVKSRTLSSGVLMNSYYTDLERIVHTKGTVRTDPYGKPTMVFKHDGGVHGIATDMQYAYRRFIKATQ